jgi:predicted permease
VRPLRRVFRLPTTRARRRREIDDELAFHLETRVERLVAEGMSPEDARRAALEQFGDVDAVRRSCATLDEGLARKTSRANLLSDFAQDLAFATRTFRRNAGFTALVVGALGVGIGANTAIFTLIDAVLLQTLPVAHPEQLIAIGDPTRVATFTTGGPRSDVVSEPIYRDVRDGNHVFSGVLASGKTGRLDAMIGSASGEPEHPSGRFVSANYFTVLGVKAASGRTFEPDEDAVAGSSPVITISYGYWTRRFHNDQSVIGSAILLDGVKMTIVGVADRSFAGEIVGQSPDIWIPLGMRDVLQASRPGQPRAIGERGTTWLLLMGRLRQGATFSQASQEVPALIERSIVSHTPASGAAAFRAAKPKYFVTDGSKGFSRVRTAFAAPLVMLLAGVALLMCIICSNVATLLLARAAARGREMAVRLALGAGRARLLRQLFTESALLAALGVTVGLALAVVGSRGLLTLAAASAPVALDLRMDGRVLAFAIATSVVCVALFGLAPALRASGADLAAGLRAGAGSIARNTMGRSSRLPMGALLIAGQVALSIVLLVGAAILTRSLMALEHTDLGADRDHLVVADVDFASRGYEGDRLAELVHSIRDRLAALPDVVAVAYSTNGIFTGSDSQTMIEVPGFEARSLADTSVSYDLASPGYAHAIGGRILAGRDLEASDEGRPPRIALVNETLAKLYFPRGDAIGKYLYFGPTIPVRIVGVMNDVRDHQLTGELPKRVYFPYIHTDHGGAELDQPDRLRFEVRTKSDPAGAVQAIRRAILSVDPALPIDGLQPLSRLVWQSVTVDRLLMQLASGFGLFALALATIGLYGVLSYSIARRTTELGLRVALGARRKDIVGMVLGDALRVFAAGALCGIPLALSLMRLVRAQLHDVGAADPASIVVSIALLAAGAMVAVVGPAVRASRVPAIVALRSD